ncbi:MAG TPA: DUF192 domain-containing protein [Acetobacteraceae bacterium]|nr:DUF192 domain-containing protein [Acetobacteraceae bacterium]
MQRRRLLGASTALLLATHLPAWAQGAEEPIHAQKELPKEKLVIVSKGGEGSATGEVRHTFDVELARTEGEQTVGLMFRKSVAPDGGMLFLWGHPIQSQMWMENTLVPLDMVFITEDGTIDSIAENTVPRSLAVISSHGPVVATLELQGGIASKLGIQVGDRVLCQALGTTP